MVGIFKVIITYSQPSIFLWYDFPIIFRRRVIFAKNIFLESHEN